MKKKCLVLIQNYNYGQFINISENVSNYHIYFNDNKEEIKREKREYILDSDNIKKIRIIIDNFVKSLSGLFRGCDVIKKISLIMLLFLKILLNLLIYQKLLY